MTSNRASETINRAFSCWPSRIGVAFLLVLTVGWGSETFVTGGQEDVVAVNATTN